MKLDYLKAIADAISVEIGKEGLTCECYYFFEEKWFHLKDKREVTHMSIVPLNKSKSESIAYHAPKSKTAWFYLNYDSAAISIDFANSPKIATRESYRKRIEETRQHAINAFKVSHHELTGLLSRDAFRARLKLSIEKLNNTQVKGIVLQSEGQDLKTVNVLAFDIDKFKQVNDTYGHIYGDQVLKAFAWRLEDAAQNLNENFQDRIDIHLGHPSGEEFLALVEGRITTDELRSIAEQFRQSIADNQLPSEDEWERLSNATDLSKVSLPHKSNRTVTTSVGVVSYTGTSPSESSPLALLDKADIALYKSKSGGRNRVTFFEEILQQCGTVLEYDLNTSVVAVDIGKKVGVLIGQEFRVYPPTFCGTAAYTIDDGRSKKILGIYPKIEICRVIIFDTQNDISFAYISSPKPFEKKIDQGALLEAVPLGNITHLIERSDLRTNFDFHPDAQLISGGKELQKVVERIIQKKKYPYAAVIKFKHETDFHKKYGSAALNRALAQLFSNLRSKFSNGESVGIIDRTAICIVGEASVFDKELISSLLNEKYPDGDELEPICGYYFPPNPSSNKDEKGDTNDDNSLSQHVIELARYALSDTESFIKERLQIFTAQSAERILSQHRKSRSYTAGIADYSRLKEIGVVSALLENSAGLCYSAIDEDTAAIECYKRGVELSPDNIIIRGNVAVIANVLNQTDIGLIALSGIKSGKLDSLRKLHIPAYWAYANLLVNAKESKSQYFDAELFKKIGSSACELENATSHHYYKRVRAALNSLPPS